MVLPDCKGQRKWGSRVGEEHVDYSEYYSLCNTQGPEICPGKTLTQPVTDTYKDFPCRLIYYRENSLLPWIPHSL